MQPQPDTQFDVQLYLHGRCHLFALVLSAKTGLPIGLFMDEEGYYDPDGNPCMALEHAYCHLPAGKGMVDADGHLSEEFLSDEYGGETAAPFFLDGAEATELLGAWMADGRLAVFLPGEEAAIGQFIDGRLAADWAAFLKPAPARKHPACDCAEPSY